MKLVVFGANGPTGRHLTEQALGEGHTVTAITRKPEGFPAKDPRLKVVGADVRDAVAVKRAVANHDAVISILGVPYSRQPITVLSHGIANIIGAMAIHDIKRLVCVTSRLVTVGADPAAEDKPPTEQFLYRKVMYPVLRHYLGRWLYDDMVRMEKLIRESDLDWTIVRPSGLFDTDKITHYHVATPDVPGLFTSRTDLANALLRETVDRGHSREIISVFTREGVPTFRELLAKELFGLGSWSDK